MTDTVTLPARVSPAEHAVLRAQAEAAGLSLAGYVRTRLGLAPRRRGRTQAQGWPVTDRARLAEWGRQGGRARQTGTS